MVIASANMVIAASGTVTLEISCLTKPMIVIYKMHALSYWFIKHLINIPYISLCNIIAQKQITKEFIQDQVNVEQICTEINRIFNDQPYCQQMVSALDTIKQQFGHLSASKQVTKIVFQLLNLSS